jgi:hypothetical protein
MGLLRDVGFGVAIIVAFSLYHPDEYFLAPALHFHAIFQHSRKVMCHWMR